MVWTLVSLGVAVLIAVQAMASLYDAQQACFVQFPSVPCPRSDDPSLGRLTFAFIGMPTIWLAGIGITAVGWGLKRRADHLPR